MCASAVLLVVVVVPFVVVPCHAMLLTLRMPRAKLFHCCTLHHRTVGTPHSVDLVWSCGQSVGERVRANGWVWARMVRDIVRGLH